MTRPAQKQIARGGSAPSVRDMDFMRLALAEAQRAGEEGNLPVGAVIVKNQRVVALGRNLVVSTGDVMAHAETVALREAFASLGKEPISGSDLYSTVEPCPMCCGAVMIHGISRVAFGATLREVLLSEGRRRSYGSYRCEELLRVADRDDVEVVSGLLRDEIIRGWHEPAGPVR